MRITVAAVGRVRNGPEAALVSSYATRATQTGRALGFGPVDVVEIDERKAPDMASQSQALLRHVGSDHLIALDERGASLTSPDFADLLAMRRDSGQRRVVFAIGGADGHDPVLRASAAMALSFGSMVWPHLLARVMLVEQVYRAMTILSGGPYHRN